MNSKRALTFPAGGVLASSSASVAYPQGAYPSRPVRVIVPFSAGDPADIYARYLEYG